jgi:hypothetical protein
MVDLGKAWPFNVVARDNREENSRVYITDEKAEALD